MPVGNISKNVFAGDASSTRTWDPRAELAGLTSLRGIAAIIVVLFHMEGVVDRLGFDLTLGPFGGVIENGYLFVDMFFILSGFVIAHVYGQKTFPDAKSYRRFLWNRLARIYPLHLFVTVVLVTTRLIPNSPPVFNDTNTPASLVSEIFLLKSLGFHDPFTWNDVSWSVSAEGFAYLLAPVILVVARPGRSSTRVAVGVIGAAWFGVALVSPDSPLPDFVRHATAVRGVLGFATGVGVYRLHRGGLVRSMALRVVAFPLTLVSIVVLTSFDVHDVLLMVAFSAFIVATVHAPDPILRLLDCKPLMHLGTISYSVYLLQMFALLIFQRYLTAKPSHYWEGVSQGSMWLLIVLFIGGLVVVSHLTYRTIERPAQAAMRKTFDR